MKHTLTKAGEDWLINLDYADEGVELAQEKKFSGSEEAANAYVPIMDADIRERYAHLFPLPIIENEEEMML